MCPNGTEFPKFPTAFTEQDVERLRQLDVQRKQLEEAYQVKFSRAAWARTPAVERAVRRVTPPWITPAIAALPGTAETFEYGLTPEQFQERMLEFEEEFRELTRRQKITRILPNVQTDLMVSALAGEPITDTSELLSTFPELRQDFTEEEIGYLARLGQALAQASPEEILSGELFASEPNQLPITEEDIDTLFRETTTDPRFIFATVEFSKDLEDVTQALKEAYPSQTTEDEAQEALRQRMRDYFQQRNQELGITVEGEVPTKEVIQKQHEAIAEKEGKAVTLVNDAGEMFPARKRTDGSVYIEDELVGYMDEKGTLYPINLQGQPAITIEAQESAAKDLWDAFYLGAVRATYLFQRAFGETIPSAIIEMGERVSIYHLWDLGKASEAQEVTLARWRDYLRGTGERLQAIHEDWLKDHPELAPRPQYLQSPIDNPELFKDPYYYGYTILSNAPIMIAALGTGLIAGVATGNPLIGAVAGAAIITPVEIQSVQEDLEVAGANVEDSQVLATLAGTLIGAIEILPGMIALKIMSPVFMRAFRRTFQRELTTLTVRELTTKGILGKVSGDALKIIGAETMEEIAQEAVQNATVKTVDESRSIVENLPDVAIQAMIATIPLGIFGAGASYSNIRANLPPAVQQEIDETSAKMKEAGLTEEHAEAVAIAQVMEDETGRTAVEEAIAKTEEQAPITSEKITNLETKITSVNEEIVVTTKSIEAQKERLAKMIAARELPGDQLAQAGLIKDLEQKVVELQSERSQIEKVIRKMRKELAKEPPPEKTTEGYTLTVYRGLNVKGKSPVDEGLVGKATYYSTNREYAGTYDGGTRQFKATLNKPFIIKSQSEWREFSNRLRELRTQAAKEGRNEDWVQETIRHQLEQEGYDGVIVYPGIVEVGTQVAIFHPEKSLSEEVIQKEDEISQEPVESDKVDPRNISPYGEKDPLLPTRRPRVLDWEDEQAGVEEALTDPTIAKNVKISDKIVEIRRIARDTLNRLQDEYEANKKKGDKEAIAETEKKLKDIATEANLRRKALLGKRWDDLPPDDKIALSISMIPDRSMKFRAIREGFDMEYFMEFMEELTGAPFYSVLRRVEAANSSAETAKERILERVSTDPYFKDIRTDEVALERVSQEINARNEIQGVEHPDDITGEEMLLVDAIGDVYNGYKPIVRYLRVMRTENDIEAFKKEFPDAVESGKEAELIVALTLKEHGNLDDLWGFLFPLDWGVIEHGFDPRLIAAPSLRIRRTRGLKTTRGKGRLLRRESIEYPAGKMSKNVLARLATYVEQMEIQWRIEPEIDTLADYWETVGEKFEDWGQVERGLETWLERVQGIGLGYNWFDRQVRKLWRQAMAAVFLEPYMAFRNSWQPIMFHPDRTELFRLIKERLPADLSEKGTLYYETFVSQLGGLRKDWLHVGERGFLIPEWWNRLADSLNLYGASDYYPRLWSFKAALNKAQRATKAYLQDNNLNKWLKDSGAVHLRQTERNYVLTHYLGQADKNFDLGMSGLRENNGADMANFYVAQRITDITHFKYRRSSRGLVEMGKTGTTLWNLIVFPRGYAQRLYFQAEKIKNVFSGEATWEESKSGFKDIMGLCITALLVDQLFQVVTGRRRNPYFVLNILFGWQFGGLFVGIAQDLSKAIGNIFTVINPITEEEDKNWALSQLPTAIERLGDTLIPFYRRAFDAAEAAIGKEHLDRSWIRKGRALLDKDYTPQELDEIDRNLWEKIRKFALGGEVPDPTKLQTVMENLEEAETRLGTQDATGRYYTIGNYGSAIASQTKSIPNALVSDQEGFEPKVLFYKECEAQWAELYTTPSTQRNEWRKEHVLEEAMLLFWEKYSKSVFDKGTPEAEQVKHLLKMWFDVYDVDKYSHSHWADWTIPPVPTTP